jgi:hypothetical protein
MKKGYGVGIYAPGYKRQEAKDRSSKYRRLTYHELIDLASSLGIDTDNDGDSMSEYELIDEIIRILRALKKVI